MPINVNRDLRKKLLHLFPIKFVKDHFNETGSRDDVVEIVSEKNTAAIVNFIDIFHDVTKQNIYLYKLGRPFVQATDMIDFPLEIAKETHINNVHSYIFLPETVYSVYLNNPVAKEDISFLQPVIIEIEGSYLKIKFTKLEKNVKSYFPQSREPKNASETNTEGETLAKITEHFQDLVGVTINDFNKGIKILWDKDELDCHKIRYRDTHSTILITMDETLTFKQQYPVKYLEMVASPIGQSVWKYMLEDINISDLFSCDPTAGTISINKYSDNTNQTRNVITKILAEN